MKYILFILLFASLSTKAQKKKKAAVTSLTTSQLTSATAKLQTATAQLQTELTAMQAKLVLKDTNDARRNSRIDAVTKRVDSGSVIPNLNDFDVDSVTKVLSLKAKADTFIIIKKAPRIPQGFAAGKSPKRAPYTVTFPNEDELKEIDDLQFQNNQYQKTINSREKVIDKLQKLINKQQADMDKLKLDIQKLKAKKK